MSECTHRIRPNVWVFSYTKIWSSFTLAHTQSHTHTHTHTHTCTHTGLQHQQDAGAWLGASCAQQLRNTHTQDYNTSKMLEHGLKSLVHDSYAVSVTNPHTYAHRFQSFLMSIVS